MSDAAPKPVPATPPRPQAPLRLHIGGWAVREGWKIMDIQPRPGADYVGNCTDLSQFADDSIAEIYASHVYEHLDYVRELPTALKEALRVLRPGGLIRIGVPDLEALSRLLLDTRIPVPDRFEVQRMMFGGHIDPYDYHKVGLTFDFLKGFLEACGFRGVQRVKFFHLFQDASTMVVNGQPISLNVSAMKPN